MFSPIVAIASVTRSRTELIGVAERLLEQDDVLEPLLELAVDDLLADLGGLARPRSVGGELGPLGIELRGRDVVDVDPAGREPGDLDRQQSRTRSWNWSVRATKSVSQLTSIRTPTRPPVWM